MKSQEHENFKIEDEDSSCYDHTCRIGINMRLQHFHDFLNKNFLCFKISKCCNEVLPKCNVEK